MASAGCMDLDINIDYPEQDLHNGPVEKDDLQAIGPPPPYTASPDGYGDNGYQMREYLTKLQEKAEQMSDDALDEDHKLVNLGTRYRQIENGEINVYGPEAVVTFKDDDKKIRKVEIGTRQPGTTEKVIMIVGATGSGKSTLINGMFNYILGVEWKDDFRLKLIQEGAAANQAKSQTSWITSYTVHHRVEFTVPYTLTIIDTPGFGDTAGIKRDQQITDQIRTCFQTQGPHGVDSLDAVGFVAQSALPRLTPSQRYIFDSILSLFGKDIADNIFMLLTFADGQKPQVLSGIKEAKLPYKKFFKFNNSALFVSNKESMETDEYGEDDNFDEMFWRMGKKSFRIFMTELGKVQAKSLLLTKDVLEERNRLEIAIEGIQKDVKMGLNKLEQLRIEHQVLDHHQSDIDKNKDFTYTVDEQIIETEPTARGQYTTNCITCNITCHEHCGIPNDEDKAGCWAMGNGNKGEDCRICDLHCHWRMHRNQPYVYVIRIHNVTKTAEDLKKRYEEAEGKKLTAEQLVKKCQEEFDEVQMRVLTLVDQARKSIDRLNQIALRTNPLSTVDYIDILINSEKSEAKPGWKERMEQLIEVKEKAEQMQALAKKTYDPFAVLKKKYDDERKQRQQMRQQQLNAQQQQKQQQPQQQQQPNP